MKKIISILLAAVMVMALLAGCGSKNSDKTNDNNTPNNNQTTELSGSVSTNGSTSMDKVIGALREHISVMGMCGIALILLSLLVPQLWQLAEKKGITLLPRHAVPAVRRA